MAAAVLTGAVIGLATVGLTYIASALKPEQALKDHLEQVQNVSQEISKRLARLKDISGSGQAASDVARLGQASGLPH